MFKSRWGLRVRALSQVARVVAGVVTGVLVAIMPPSTAMAQSEALGGENSILRITNPASLPATRKVTIGLRKAMIVELPVDNHDIVVSHTDTIDATLHTARRIMLYAKAPGEANVFFLGRDGRKLLILDITVKRDVSDLAEMYRRLLPGSRLKVSASGEGVVLSGSVQQPSDASRAEEMAKQYVKNAPVVNLIGVAEKEQVLLKITVAEVYRDAIKRLGIDLPQALARAGSFTVTKVIQNALPVSAAVAPAAIFNGPGQIPGVIAGNALQATGNWNGASASAIIQSFERVGLSRILAEPTLTAISGETAKFLAGGEFPVPVSSTNNTIAVTFKSFGVNIAFTPFVLAEGRINLKVAAEVSELSSQGAVTIQNISIPALQVRRTETVVEMPSGSALAIAGLLSDQTRQNVEGVPELMHLPVLGNLFRSKDYRSSQSELVILITPIIVRPADPRELSRADEGFAPPTDLKGLLLGHLHRIYSRSKKLANNILNDDVGFIVEYPEHGDIK